MSNYITIESGYYEPFKENETDPELKIWADKYFEIIKKIHEVLSPYNKRFEHLVELNICSKESIRSLVVSAVSAVDDLSELKEELRKCLLHRVWKSNNSVLIKESNFVSVGFDKSNGNLLFKTCSPWEIEVYSFAELTYKGIGSRYRFYCYEFDESNERNEALKRERFDINTFEMTYSIINDIKSKGVSSLSPDFLCYVVANIIKFTSMCSIIETYKDFQSGNIEKVINDKIKCGGYVFYSDFRCRH